MARYWRHSDPTFQTFLEIGALDTCMHLFWLDNVLEDFYCSVSWVALDGKILETL